MYDQTDEVRQRLKFIDRTIRHAANACNRDSSVPPDLKYYVQQLSVRSRQAKQALHSENSHRIRRSVDGLAQLTEHAQAAIHPADEVNYEVKSAVILTHIEVSALKHQLV